MIDLILNNQKLAIWAFNLLIGISGLVISMLFGFTIFYVKEVITREKANEKKLSELAYNILSYKESANRNFQTLHSSNKSIGEEVDKLRRAVVRGTVLIRGRKAEINKILDDQRRAKDKLELFAKIHEAQIRAIKRSRNRYDLLESKVVILSDELKMMKNKNNGSGKK